MSQIGYQHAVIAPARSGNASATVGFFTEALAQNVATAMYDIPMMLNLSGQGRRMMIREIVAIADDNFGPQYNFFAKNGGHTADPDTDLFLGRVTFASADGQQIAAAGLWRYVATGLAIPYYDLDQESVGAQGGPSGGALPQNTLMRPQKLHVILQNTSATAKAATGPAAGRVNTTFWVEFMQSF
jgi:hypothetical protein